MKTSARWCRVDGQKERFSKTLTSNAHVISVTVPFRLLIQYNSSARELLILVHFFRRSLSNMHSRPQSARFFWSRGRRNGGLWTQPLPDVRNFLTSVSACVVAFNTTAHAHMLILREGEGREFIVMADREKMSTKRSKESLIFIYAERSRVKAI